ncbi:hypothetical protein [Nocardioides mangrovi]|uniref:Uncharacterized protein n=1 Tax=Nocardioides mangrovi TaxID=2874580 RepID=A0ABS7UBV0_9ACTN|nr:hypothetical protein [Nocardioides mangrovi]MBZ5738132.1 hypothetical protein [Nocardioides mangrovi]
MFEVVLPIEARTVSGRRLQVAHSAAGLSRGLEFDEYVVLRDATDDRRFLGRVVDLEFDLEDTYYSVHVDGALAEAVADRYVTAGGTLETNEVADLLRQLAGERVAV